MNNTLDYTILHAQGSNPQETIQALQAQVSLYCRSGWMPAGGVSLVFSENSFYDRSLAHPCQGAFVAAQAMTWQAQAALPVLDFAPTELGTKLGMLEMPCLTQP